MLFTIQNLKAVPYPEALLLEPFKSIWERDLDKNKEKALKDFTYMEFMSSQRSSNPFKDIPENARHKMIIDRAFKGKDYKPDELVKQGIKDLKHYQEKMSVAYRLLLSARKGVEELESFFYNLDLKERTKQGAPVYKPIDIDKAIDVVGSAIKKLKEYEKTLFEDTKDGIRIMAGKELNYFNHPENFEKDE